MFGNFETKQAEKHWVLRIILACISNAEQTWQIRADKIKQQIKNKPPNQD